MSGSVAEPTFPFRAGAWPSRSKILNGDGDLLRQVAEAYGVSDRHARGIALGVAVVAVPLTRQARAAGEESWVAVSSVLFAERVAGEVTKQIDEWARTTTGMPREVHVFLGEEAAWSVAYAAAVRFGLEAERTVHAPGTTNTYFSSLDTGRVGLHATRELAEAHQDEGTEPKADDRDWAEGWTAEMKRILGLPAPEREAEGWPLAPPWVPRRGTSGFAALV